MSSDRLGLPAVLADIAEVAGIDAARTMAAAKGGQVVYIPHKASPTHWLVLLVGEIAAEKICTHFSSVAVGGRSSGQRVLIPMANVRSGEVLARAIEQGGSATKIAALTGRHERTVWRYRRRIRNGKLGPLFD